MQNHSLRLQPQNLSTSRSFKFLVNEFLKAIFCIHTYQNGVSFNRSVIEGLSLIFKVVLMEFSSLPPPPLSLSPHLASIKWLPVKEASTVVFLHSSALMARVCPVTSSKDSTMKERNRRRRRRRELHREGLAGGKC